MKRIRDFENTFGINVSELTREKLVQIMQDGKFKTFSKNFESLSALLEELLEVHKKETELGKIILTFKLVSDMMNNEFILGNLFNDFKSDIIDKNALEEKMKSFMTSSDPLFVLASGLCAMIGTEIEISDYESSLRDAIEKIETEIFPNLPEIEDSYIVVSNILDLLYQLREYYFVRYQIDLLQDDSIVDEQLRRCNEYGEKLLGEIPDSGIAPEELGYIDITKLNKGEDEDGTI